MSIDECLTEVKQVVDALDPEELLALGSPQDEYDHESRIFADLLRDGHRVAADDVERIWVDRFYPGCGLVRRNLVTALADALSRIEGVAR